VSSFLAEKPLASMQSGKEIIEKIARSKGMFAESFIQKAQQEAEEGRTGMLEAIEGAEELRMDLSRSLKLSVTLLPVKT
jgi:hypothetical protein